jgi:hypothetical protein
MAQRAVYKSTAAEFLDGMFSGTAKELKEAYRRSLGLIDQVGTGSLSQAAAAEVGPDRLPESAVENSERGWRAKRNVDRIIRLGYQEAIRLAHAHKPRPLPIETLWVTGAGGDFELHICEGTRQVTVTMFIPLSRSWGSRRAAANSWVVRAGEARGPYARRLSQDGEPSVVMVQVSGARPDED